MDSRIDVLVKAMLALVDLERELGFSLMGLRDQLENIAIDALDEAEYEEFKVRTWPSQF